jgi:4-alpha-glucanotransferase
MDQYIPLKKYANDKGIILFGDLPFYVNYNSRDVFVQSKNFDLDKKGCPRFQAAVPPDNFQEKGQLWGTPVYNWGKIEEDKFSYWVKKLSRLEDFYDYLRIDHFRGLESFYQVPWNAEDGTKGEWIKAPGEKLLQTLKRTSKIKLIAENLGYITPEVEYLLEKFNIPGMKILQFSLEDLYLMSEKSDTVYYTGTHDNQTLLSWIREKYSPEEELEKDLIWDFIKKVYYSKASWAIIPFQDLLELDDSARMNTPGTTEGNWIWTWDGELPELVKLEEKLKKLTITADRS